MGKFFDELKRRNVVRVCIVYIVVAWLAFQLGEILLPTFGAPEWIFKTLIFLIILGFPFVLLFAWAFEITPEGVKKTRDVELAESITGSTGRKIDFIIIAALVVALGYFIWESREPVGPVSQPVAETPNVAVTESVPPPIANSRSIAVLPFDDMSPDGDQEWFADGLAEEILNALARTPDLLVSARKSSFIYKGSNEDVPTIAAALGVQHILEGSVRRSANRLRVTAQLIRASDGFHLWSQSYDRTPDDMIEIQENVAIEIAKALQTAMDPEALAEMVSVGTRSIPAYEAYLQGIAYGIDSETTGDIYEYTGARDAYERAIELDPEFAQAHWQLAFFWSDLMSPSSFAFGILETPMDEMRTMFVDSIQNAIRYENVPASRAKYRSLQAEFNGRPGQALRFTTEYLSHRPNDHESQVKMMNLQGQLGLVDELKASILDFVERSPHNSFVNDTALLRSLNTGDDELTREIAYNALRNIPDGIFVKYQAHRALLWVGDIDGASRLVPALRNSDYDESIRDLIEIRQACADNRLELAAALIADVQSTSEQDLWMQWFVLHMSDRQDEAVELLRPLDNTGDFTALYAFASYAYFDPRPYPNFMAHRLSEGGISSVPIEIPYRCKFPEPDT